MKYNKDNILGITFTHSYANWGHSYTVEKINNEFTCKLSSKEINWKAVNYSIQDILDNLNNDSYKIIQPLIPIYELW